MFVVGREREERQIIKALGRGENVILTGKYGIGRTCLLRKVAEATRDRWRFVFVDFSQRPGKVCELLFRELLPPTAGRKQKTGAGYKPTRFRIGNLPLADPRPHVLVLDNIAKLTPQKLDLLRYLVMADRFRFALVVENFLNGDELFLLRARLGKAAVICLPHLSQEAAKQYFRYFLERYRFAWTEGEINSLAEMSGGYPLGMWEIVKRNLVRSRSLEENAPGGGRNGAGPGKFRRGPEELGLRSQRGEASGPDSGPREKDAR